MRTPYDGVVVDKVIRLQRQQSPMMCCRQWMLTRRRSSRWRKGRRDLREERWDREVQRKERRESCDMFNLFKVIWVIDIAKSTSHVQSMLDCKQRVEKYVRLWLFLKCMIEKKCWHTYRYEMFSEIGFLRIIPKFSNTNFS